MRRLAAFAVLLTALAVMAGLAPAARASAPVPSPAVPGVSMSAAAAGTLTAAQAGRMAGTALDWARSQAGKPYVWAGNGPGGYDCSGLVVAAFRRLGVTLPRTTYQMYAAAAGRRLLRFIPVAGAPRGAILFFGTGHVEFATAWWHQSYGAQKTGTLIGYHRWFPPSWQPTAAALVY